MPGSAVMAISHPLVSQRSPWPTSAYVHLPFCRQRCFYCDFPIAVVQDRSRLTPISSGIGEHTPAMTTYIESLCQEIAWAPAGPAPLQTVFFGGGTPSLAPPAQLHRILSTLEQQLGLDSAAEISIEMDPGTFTLTQLQGYQSAGVNRVSLGVQALTDELLQVCGRGHTVKDVYEAIESLQQANISNFSLDLISGLPAQTLTGWQETLTTAIELAPAHLSIYDLTIEPTTLFGQKYQPGAHPLPTDETTADMYRWASSILRKAGYIHYEISNYAQPDYQCQHNQVYWHNEPYYGFGMGATSYLWKQRFSRPRTLGHYYQWVQDLQTTQGEIDCPISTAIESLQETLMLGLRLATGLNIKQLKEQFGGTVVEQILTALTPYQTQGWVVLQDLGQPSASVRLTDPEGFLFSNTILASVWQALE